MEKEAQEKVNKRSIRLRQMHIGLTGSMASGKGELARCLTKLNFSYISLSDMVREEAVQRGIETLSREEMQNIGNELRKKGGAGVLAKRVKAKIRAAEDQAWVIDGIRNPAEVEELRKLPHFYLIGIQSNLKLLVERLNTRNRQTDSAPPSELKKVIHREWGCGEPGDGQQVGKCMRLTDFTIDNNGTLKNLHEKCREILRSIEEKNV